MEKVDPTENAALLHRLAKPIAGLASVLVIGLVLSPVAENWTCDPRDNFPLSHYPMFSKKRSETIRITHLVGHDSQGNSYRIRYTYSGTGGLNQVRKLIRRQVAAGRAEELCRALANRVRRSSSETLAEIETVSIVTSSYALDKYLVGDKSPLSQTVEASWEVR